MQEIENGIYINNNYPGVTLGALISQNGTLMIDAPPQPDDGRAWASIVRNMGGAAYRVLVVLDDHPDRAIGLRAMDTAVISQDLTSQSLENRHAIFKGHQVESGAEWELCEGLSGIRWQKPSITFTEQAILEWGDQKVYLEHQPGPTSGSAWLIVPDLKVIFVGDTLTNQQPPFIAEANIDHWVASLDILATKKYKDYLIISGRGGIVDHSEIRETRRFLKEVEKRLIRFYDRNADPEEITKTIGNLLTRFDFPPQRETIYFTRLENGLKKYYIRHFMPDPEEEGE